MITIQVRTMTIANLIEQGRAIRGIIVRTPKGNLATVQGADPVDGDDEQFRDPGFIVEVDGGGYLPAADLEYIGTPNDNDLARTFVATMAMIAEFGLEKVRAAHIAAEDEALDDIKDKDELRELFSHVLEHGCKGIANMDVYELATDIATRYEGEDATILMATKINEASK